MMKKLTLSLANEATERILELSADTQITRRMTAKDSPAFHNLTGAITAYGKTLALLTALLYGARFSYKSLSLSTRTGESKKYEALEEFAISRIRLESSGTP
jgi:hypothetical protein